MGPAGAARANAFVRVATVAVVAAALYAAAAAQARGTQRDDDGDASGRVAEHSHVTAMALGTSEPPSRELTAHGSEPAPPHMVAGKTQAATASPTRSTNVHGGVGAHAASLGPELERPHAVGAATKSSYKVDIQPASPLAQRQRSPAVGAAHAGAGGLQAGDIHAISSLVREPLTAPEEEKAFGAAVDVEPYPDTSRWSHAAHDPFTQWQPNLPRRAAPPNTSDLLLCADAFTVEWLSGVPHTNITLSLGHREWSCTDELWHVPVAPPGVARPDASTMRVTCIIKWRPDVTGAGWWNARADDGVLFLAPCFADGRLPPHPGMACSSQWRPRECAKLKMAAEWDAFTSVSSEVELAACAAAAGRTRIADAGVSAYPEQWQPTQRNDVGVWQPPLPRRILSPRDNYNPDALTCSDTVDVWWQPGVKNTTAITVSLGHREVRCWLRYDAPDPFWEEHRAIFCTIAWRPDITGAGWANEPMNTGASRVQYDAPCLPAAAGVPHPLMTRFSQRSNWIIRGVNFATRSPYMLARELH